MFLNAEQYQKYCLQLLCFTDMAHCCTLSQMKGLLLDEVYRANRRLLLQSENVTVNWRYGACESFTLQHCWPTHSSIGCLARLRAPRQPIGLHHPSSIAISHTRLRYGQTRFISCMSNQFVCKAKGEHEPNQTAASSKPKGKVLKASGKSETAPNKDEDASKESLKGSRKPKKVSRKSENEFEESERKPLRLILLRHAKSSWDDPTLEDHERPLNKRGRKAAPDVAAQLRTLGWLPELILSSDSVRTQETLKRMSEEWGRLGDVPTEFLHTFYEGQFILIGKIRKINDCKLLVTGPVAAIDDGPTDTARHLEEVVLDKAKSARCVMLVGHNMGWEQAASQFVGEDIQMKTAYAVLLESPCSSWKEAFQDKWQLSTVIKPESSKS